MPFVYVYLGSLAFVFGLLWLRSERKDVREVRAVAVEARIAAANANEALSRVAALTRAAASPPAYALTADLDALGKRVGHLELAKGIRQ